MRTGAGKRGARVRARAPWRTAGTVDARGAPACAGAPQRRATFTRAGSCLRDVGGLRTLLALDDLELHLIAFLKRLEAARLDRAVVDEHIGTSLTGDEAESLRVVEPLDRAGDACHSNFTSPRGRGQTVMPIPLERVTDV